jgi:tripartite-type tricarboxylate transporter receptor subunit TctC
MKRKAWKVEGVTLLCGIVLLMMPTLLMSQQYPERPINLTIAQAVGGATDPAVRSMAAAAEKILGQPILVTNKGGGGGSVGWASVAKERPDGYHLLGGTTSGILYVPNFREVPYALEDFVPILTFGQAPPTGIMVRSDSPWKTLKELVDYAKKNPGAVTVGTNGAGSPQHLAMEFIGQKEGFKYVHVPFKGSGEVAVALLGGHITASSAGVIESADQVKAGKLRILAFHEAKGMKTFPDVKTLKEQGYNFVTGLYFIIMAPKGTPPAIVNKLQDAFRKGMDDPNFIKVLTSMEMPILYQSSDETSKFLKEAYPRVEQVVKPLNIPKVKD